MNRIDQLKPGQTPPGAPTQPASRPQGAPSFQELLDQANQAGQTSQSGGLAAGQGLEGLAGVQAADAANPLAAIAGTEALGPDETEGLLRAERTLDLLEAYQTGLADGKKSLKELSGLVKALDEEVGELTTALQQLQPDSKLHGLMSQVAVTAMVESIKFNRGDYNPSAPEAGEEAEA